MRAYEVTATFFMWKEYFDFRHRVKGFRHEKIEKGTIYFVTGRTASILGRNMEVILKRIPRKLGDLNVLVPKREEFDTLYQNGSLVEIEAKNFFDRSLEAMLASILKS